MWTGKAEGAVVVSLATGDLHLLSRADAHKGEARRRIPPRASRLAARTRRL